MTIRVTELRLSFVWFEPFPGGAGALSSLADPKAYQNAFLGARRGAKAFKLPWRNLLGQHFWEYYLEKAVLDQVAWEKAWKSLIPLCPPSLPKAKKPPAPYYRVAVEGFLYPHGVAASVIMVLKEDMALANAVERAMEARHTKIFDLTWPDKTTTQGSLEDMGKLVLDFLRTTALGSSARRESPLAEPFSVATAVDGSVPDPATPNPSNGDVHRALEALCSFHPLWRINTLHPLDETTCLRFKDKGFMPDGHLLYGLERSRAIWFPGYFSRIQGRRIRKLGCYHNNLSLVSLHTESLVSLMRRASEFIRHHRSMSLDLEKLVRSAAGTLGRLYGGIEEKTYRSWSPRRQMEDGKSLGVIDQVRDFFGMSKLSV